MSNLEKDLKKAKYLIENHAFYRNHDSMFDMIYPFTNENINGMFDCFNFKEKDCLSILGSSDQVFDMFLRGAKSVTAFDINPLTKYLFYLKRAALRANLTKEEYLSFFWCSQDYTESLKSFNEKTFVKIVPFLKGNSYKFWTNLFTRYKGYKIREENCLFSFDEYKRPTLEKTVHYLNDKEFKKIKEMSPSIKITFINQNLKDLVLNKYYDLMYFSNLIQYANSIFNPDTLYETKLEEEKAALQEFKNFIMRYQANLNDDCIIIIGYIFTIFEECDIPAIFNKKTRDEIFPDDTYYYEYFPSTCHFENVFLSNVPTHEKDACLVYKKSFHK